MTFVPRGVGVPSSHLFYYACTRVRARAPHPGPASARNASLLKGDTAEAVAKLKEQPGANLLKFGTGELDRTLLEHGLVDEFHFWSFPVLVGGAQHLIDGIEPTHLELLDAVGSGIVVHVLGPRK
jgi:dihydrofolate reductase